VKGRNLDCRHLEVWERQIRAVAMVQPSSRSG
jgi:hypothetical protein